MANCTALWLGVLAVSVSVAFTGCQTAPETDKPEPAAGRVHNNQAIKLDQQSQLVEGRNAYKAGDYDKAKELLTPLAESGELSAQLTLGMVHMHENDDVLTPKALTWFRMAAEQGNSVAQGMLGLAYLSGSGLRQDYSLAYRWFLKSARQANALSEYKLGMMYFIGTHVPQDYIAAAKWIRQAAIQGYAEAQQSLGAMHYDGQGVAQDFSQAAKWYRKAAEQGLASAQDRLGYLYGHGEGVRQNYRSAVEWYRAAARQGDANAQFNLGVMYWKGYGVQEDMATAAQWLLKATEQKHAHAKEWFGKIPLEVAATLRERKDPVTAMHLVVRHAQQGNVTAQVELGDVTLETKDYEKSVYWYEQAARQDHARARIMLASLYGAGWGVAQNLQIAADWARLSAEQGYSLGQTYLGTLYGSGKGVPQDYSQAAYWYSKAAAQGEMDAQYLLGGYYAMGMGVAQDFVQAHMWFNLAASQGRNGATRYRNIVARELTGSQLAEAQALARDWRPRFATKAFSDSRESDSENGLELNASGSGFVVTRAGDVLRKL